MIPLGLQQINDFLLSNKFQAQIEAKTQQIYFPIQVENKSSPVFLRTTSDSDLLQIIVFLPKTAKAEHFGDLARLLHTFNRELDMPGFGMNEETGHIFFRSVIPCTQRQLDGKLLLAYIVSLQSICTNFIKSIALVAEGFISYEELLKKAKQMPQQNN